MIEILRDEGNFVAVRLSGKLEDADYTEFVPVIQGAAEKGKLHLLVDMREFEGWDARALWDDIQFDARHGGQIERVAFIGDARWHTWMAKICRPFTWAQMQFFSAEGAEDARAWAQDGLQDYED
jgi:universal stress protein A